MVNTIAERTQTEMYLASAVWVWVSGLGFRVQRPGFQASVLTPPDCMDSFLRGIACLFVLLIVARFWDAFQNSFIQKVPE